MVITKNKSITYGYIDQKLFIKNIIMFGYLLFWLFIYSVPN